MALTQEQIQSIYTARPDVQTYYQDPSKTKKYGGVNRAVSHWYDVYTKGGGASLLGGATTPTTAVSTIPGTNYQTFQADPFSFDPNQYLPDIQKQATSIYQPQIQALESLRQLGTKQAETAKVSNEADFQKQLQQEIESINRRGAFFSGGAKQYETGLQEQHQRDISSLALQAQAADFQNIAQQAGLNAEQTQFIQNQLYSQQGSAYQRYQDAYQNAWQNYQFTVQTAEQARQFQQNLNFDMLKFAKELKLSKEAAKLARDKFNEDVKQSGLLNAYNNSKLAQEWAKINTSSSSSGSSAIIKTP